MKNDALAKVLIDLAGGKDNLRSASHCMTRLRFKVKDDSLVKQEEIKKTEGVMGLVVKADEYQIVIGPGVGKVYDEVIRQTGLKAEAMVDDAQARKEDKKKKGGLLSMALDTVAGIFIPAIGLIAGGGALKGFLAVFVQLGLLASDSGTYTVLYALGDSVFYFFPIIIGYNSGKKFGGNPILTAGLGCALIYPTLITAVTEGTALTLFGIPLTLLNYTQSAFPIIFISYLAVKLEKLFKKILPDVTQVILIAGIVNAIYGASPIVAGGVVGGIWQLTILGGVQWGVTPIFIQNITEMGYCPIMACLGCTVFGQVGAAVAAGLRSKNKKYRSVGLGSGLAGILGVSEPAIYGINVPAKKPFFIGLGASAVGGLVCAIFGGKQYVPGGAGIFVLPGMINPEAGIDMAFWGVVLSCIVALVVAFISIYCDIPFWL